MDNITYHWDRLKELPYVTLDLGKGHKEEMSARDLTRLIMQGNMSEALVVDAYLLRILSPLETIDTPEGMKVTPEFGLWYRKPNGSAPGLGFYRRKWPHTSGNGEICIEQYGFCEDGSPGSFHNSMGVTSTPWSHGKAFRYSQERVAFNDLISQQPEVSYILDYARAVLNSDRK